MPLVKTIVGSMWRRLPAHADFDDLMQAGSMGLMDAVKKFDAAQKVPFACYAKFRIRGAILDNLRQVDDLTRTERQKVKLQNKIEQEVPDAGTAAARDISTFTCFTRSRIGVSAASTWDTAANEGPEIDPAAKDDTPEQLYGKHVVRKLLAETMGVLPTRYQHVLKLYYEGDMTMKEIGKALGVNESRISQLHRSALTKMAAALADRGLQSSAMLMAS